VYHCTSGTIFIIMVILASMNTNLAQSALLGLSMDKGEIPIRQSLSYHPIKRYVISLVRYLWKLCYTVKAGILHFGRTGAMKIIW